MGGSSIFRSSPRVPAEEQHKARRSHRPRHARGDDFCEGWHPQKAQGCVLWCAGTRPQKAKGSEAAPAAAKRTQKKEPGSPGCSSRTRDGANSRDTQHEAQEMPPSPALGAPARVKGLLVQKLARPINLMRFCSQGLLSARRGAALQREHTGGSWKPGGFGTAQPAVKAGPDPSVVPPRPARPTPQNQARPEPTKRT